jgi:hypothetical protein
MCCFSPYGGCVCTASCEYPTPWDCSACCAALQGPDCPICYTPTSILNFVVTPCSHSYHQTCLEPWFEASEETANYLSCPTCRRILHPIWNDVDLIVSWGSVSDPEEEDDSGDGEEEEEDELALADYDEAHWNRVVTRAEMLAMVRGGNDGQSFHGEEQAVESLMRGEDTVTVRDLATRLIIMTVVIAEGVNAENGEGQNEGAPT